MAAQMASFLSSEGIATVKINSCKLITFIAILCQLLFCSVLGGLLASPEALAVTPEISAGDGFSIVLKSDGTVWGWGANSGGQLNDGTGTTTSTPVLVLDLGNIVHLTSGTGHTLAVKPDGMVWGWGSNFYGELGGGHNFAPPNGQFRMVASDYFNDAETVAAGGNFSLVLDQEGRLWAWGRNVYRQLGDGTTNSRVYPVSVSGLSDVVAAAAGTEHAVALRSNGTVWTWGRNTFGQLGDGSSIDRSIPAQVSDLVDIVTVSAGADHTIALKSDGTVWAWGLNSSGQLGDGTTTNRMAPVRVGELTNVTMIATGDNHNLALKSDGSVWAWGSNYSGQVGDGTEITIRETPMQVGGLPTVMAVAAGTSNSLAIDEQGRVWQWGKVWVTSTVSTDAKSPQLLSGPDTGGYLNVFEPAPEVPVEESIGIWPKDLAVGTSPYDQLSIDIVGDNIGGSYIVWSDVATAGVWAQHLDALGRARWGVFGNLVAKAPALNPRVAPDGTGGLLVAWQDGRNGSFCNPAYQGDCDIYAQRIDSRGLPIWSSGGVPVVTAQGNQSEVAIVGDGQGGGIVVWQDPRPPYCCRLFAQHIDASGQIMWQKDGIPVSPEVTYSIGAMDESILVDDGTGGAILAWSDNQVEPPMLTLQRIDASGQLLWGSPGTVIGTPSHTHSSFKMINDEAGGAIVVYSVTEGVPGSSGTDIKIQHVLSNGVTAWQEGGVWVSHAPRSQINPQIVGDRNGGAIVTWQHEPDEENAGCFSVFGECDIFAQRLDSNGNVLWQENGIPVSAADHSQHTPILVADGEGGAVIAWQDCRRYPARDHCASSMDIYVQRLTASGDVLWPVDGVPLTKELGNQGIAPGTPILTVIRGIADSGGGATFVWPDGRETFCSPSYIGSNCDVFAQRVLLSTDSTPHPTKAMPWIPLLLGD